MVRNISVHFTSFRQDASRAIKTYFWPKLGHSIHASYNFPKAIYCCPHATILEAQFCLFREQRKLQKDKRKEYKRQILKNHMPPGVTSSKLCEILLLFELYISGPEED